MADENIRIIAQEELNTLTQPTYVLTDNQSDGTHKYDLNKLALKTEMTAAIEAETSARATAISAERTARQEADEALEQDVSDLKEDLSDLESDGVVASAEQLLSDKYTIDQVPYHYRASGGNGADREFDEIVGGTVNWNQLCSNKAYTNTNTDTRDYLSLRFASSANFTIIGDVSTVGAINVIVAPNYTAIVALKHSGGSKDLNFATNIPFVAGHKYFVHIDVLSASPSVVGGASTDNQMVHDLTAMFNPTVADYIYNLEQTTAGAGVALFRQLFPEDYYEYNAGTLRSVEGLQSHEMVGFNQWDEEWEVGTYSTSDGSPSGATNSIRGKNPIKCLPNTTYYFKTTSGLFAGNVFFYTDDDAFIKAITAYGNHTFDTPSNCAYMRISMGTTYGTTYKNDICINISSDRNGEYEPYVKHIYPLDSSLTLRGIPKLDSGNQIYFDGDTYAADGTVTRKYGIVDLGTLSWTHEADSKQFYSNIFASGYSGWMYNVFCSKYIQDHRTYTVVAAPHVRGINNNRIYIIDDSYTDVASFKAAMSGVYLVYELATPTTETATPYRSLQKVDPYGTEEYISTSIVPIGHYTKYPENLKAKIENLDLSMIAPIEKGTTASQAYAVGKYFLLNNKFCKAKTAIASGATFTLNTNYEVTTIADELYTALNA